MSARDNPFATERLESLPFRPPPGGWGPLLARLDRLGRRAAVIGPRGRGKTALLEALAPRLDERGFVPRLVRHGSTPDHTGRRVSANVGSPCANTIVLYDGAGKLGPWAWAMLLRATRHAAGLVVTAHRTCPLPTWVRCRPDATTLRALVRDLVGRHTEASLPIETLFARHRGDVRAALLELYDAWARREIGPAA